jgi:UDP-glucose 4-epimerase
VDLLLNQGFQVIVIDNLATGSMNNLNPAADFHQLDIRSQEAHDLIINTKPVAIFHLAAQASVRISVADPIFDASVNIQGSINLFQAAVQAGVEKILFSSTGGAIYGEQDYFPADEQHPVRPVCPYGVAKLSVEKYLHFYQHEYGLKYIALRYANVYGPRQDPHGEAGVVAIFSQKLLKDEQAIINGDGKQTRDFVYVQDVARANLAALKADFSGEINIGTGLETDINDLFGHLNNITGASQGEKHGPAMPGEQRRSVVDYSRAKKILAWEPSTSLTSGLQATVDYFRQARGIKQ